MGDGKKPAPNAFSNGHGVIEGKEEQEVKAGRVRSEDEKPEAKGDDGRDRTDDLGPVHTPNTRATYLGSSLAVLDRRYKEPNAAPITSRKATRPWP